MSEADPSPCPTCSGLSQPDHPAGLLGGWRHEQSCSLLALEDARAVVDADQLVIDCWGFTRDATSTERTLLAALGWTWPDTDPLETTVGRLTAAVRSRFWLTATPPTTTEGAPA